MLSEGDSQPIPPLFQAAFAEFHRMPLDVVQRILQHLTEEQVMAGQPMVNKPLIRPYFWGGTLGRGYVDQFVVS